tara:strand:- start:5140 stop:5838 length:699 start_codon:yes stop_codon:yes gene_type:complete
MSNELTKFLEVAGLPVIDDSQLAAALSEAADAAMTSGGGGSVDYLSFSGKTGRYSLGRDQEEIDPDQLYLVEPKTFVGGWVCWKNSKPIDRIEWSVLKAKEQAVALEDLEDHGPYRESAGEGWQQLLGFGLISCDAMKSQIKFSSTSKSGRNTIGGLMKEICARAEVKEPSLPLILFGSTTFESNGQTNYKPVLEVESWVMRESAASYLEGDLTEQQLSSGDKPKKKARKKK